jgi:hypothetical protein
MSITIGSNNFEGPFPSTQTIEDRSGVYAILSENSDGKYTLIDVGESAGVKTRLDSHDRRSCWLRKCSSPNYAVYYTPNLQSAGRVAIEQEIRSKYNPPCGVI